MRISIHHQLSVSPPPGTNHAVMQVLLTPQSGSTQKVESWTLDMPGIDNASRFTDAYGNQAHLVNQNKPEGELLVTVKGVVETADRHGVLGRASGEPVPQLFLRITPLTKSPAAVWGKFRNSKDKRLDVLHGLMARVGEVLDPPPAEPQAQSQTQSQGGQSQSQAKMSADGSPVDPPPTVELPTAATKLPRPPATDFAHAFVAGARALKIPARYVTGYLLGADEQPSVFHAWAEAFDDRLGWIGFDPMLQLCPTERHIRLAAGLDAYAATPLRIVPSVEPVQEKIVELAVVE